MILVDVNLLIYAIDSDAAHHAKAHAWLEDQLSGESVFGLAWSVVLGFLRVTTHPRIMRRPLAPERALAYVSEWFEQPNVVTVTPGEKHWPILRNLLTGSGTAGNLTTDAHLAALALEHGYAVCSADNDFKRFSGLTHINPLQ